MTPAPRRYGRRAAWLACAAVGLLGCGPNQPVPPPSTGAAILLDPAPYLVLGVGHLEVWVADGRPTGEGVRVVFGSPQTDSVAVYEVANGTTSTTDPRPRSIAAELRARPVEGEGGRRCALGIDTEIGTVLFGLDQLTRSSDSAVEWPSRPHDGGRYVASVTASPDGDALGLLATDAPPDPVWMGPPAYHGPFFHEVYEVPSLRRVAGPERVGFVDGDKPWGPCWSPAGAAAVYVSAGFDAISVVAGLAL